MTAPAAAFAPGLTASGAPVPLLGDGPHKCLAWAPTPWERKRETMPYTIRRKADGGREAVLKTADMPDAADCVWNVVEDIAGTWAENFAEKFQSRFRAVPDGVREEIAQLLSKRVALPEQVEVPESEFAADGGFTADLRDWFTDFFRHALVRHACKAAEDIRPEVHRILRMAFRKRLAELLDALDAEAGDDR